MKSRFYVTKLRVNAKGDVVSDRPFFERPEDAIAFAGRELGNNRAEYAHVVEVLATVRPKPVAVVVERYRR